MDQMEDVNGMMATEMARTKSVIINIFLLFPRSIKPPDQELVSIAMTGPIIHNPATAAAEWVIFKISKLIAIRYT